MSNAVEREHGIGKGDIDAPIEEAIAGDRENPELYDIAIASTTSIIIRWRERWRERSFVGLGDDLLVGVVFLLWIIGIEIHSRLDPANLGRDVSSMPTFLNRIEHARIGVKYLVVVFHEVKVGDCGFGVVIRRHQDAVVLRACSDGNNVGERNSVRHTSCGAAMLYVEFSSLPRFFYGLARHQLYYLSRA